MRNLLYLVCISLTLVAGVPFGSAQNTTATLAADENTTSFDRHPALVPAARTGNAATKFNRFHQEFLKRGKEGPIDILFLGDSITERWAKDGAKVWEEHYANRKTANFGIGGDRTQQVLWRIDHGELNGIAPKVLVLMIGTNNSNSDEPEATIAGIESIIERIQSKLPETKILLLGIFPRNSKRNMPENMPMQRVLRVNEAISKLDNGQSIRYLDISSAFLPDGAETVPPELMPDGVHLSEAGYEAWAKTMEPLLKEMLEP